MNANSLLATTVASLLCLVTAAARDGWSHDFDAASRQAAAEKKDLLLDFTGSDWCGPCIALDRDIFSKPAFGEEVKNTFVLIELDYPKDKTKIDAVTLKQNQKLQGLYGVAAYPTILLCDAGGRPYAATGYRKTTPEAYVKSLDELRSKRTVRDEAFAKAAAATGPEKASLLASALIGLGLEDTILASSYGEVLDQIRQADPANPFLRRALSKRQLARFNVQLEAFLEEPGIHMVRGVADGERDNALAMIAGIIATNELEPADLAEITIYRAVRILAMESADKAIESLNSIPPTDLDPAALAKLDACRKSLEARKKAE